jgi:hypothetical protein
MLLPTDRARWLLLVFSLPAKRGSERVNVWRKLKKLGALSLGTSGYLLPLTPENHEKFEWLAAFIRRYKGQASVVQVHSIDELPNEDLVRRFVDARSQDYETLIAELKKLGRMRNAGPQLARLRRRFQEVATIDFFNSPLRSRLESLLARAAAPSGHPQKVEVRRKKGFQNRIWVTRPRPGIDRVSSAWLITKFIDPRAKFIFAKDSKPNPGAIPFDMFQAEGFGHRDDDCTFETLRKEFGIRGPKVAAIAEIIHDADLDDGKFGRTEGAGLDRVLIGWAQQDVSDEELLRRGIELIEGLYQSLT